MLMKYNWILFLITLLMRMSLFATQDSYVIRAAIDIGSGGPKLRVAEVDLSSNKIIRILHNKQYPIFFHESVSRSDDKKLSSEMMSKGLIAFKDALAVAKSLGADKVVAVATASFRTATNGTQFAVEIENETGIKVHIIDQYLEGKLAFQAALSQLDTPSENLVVWDIGGGSTQLIGKKDDGSYVIDLGNEGSGAFRNHLIGVIQHRSIKEFKSPNPLSVQNIKEGEAHAYALSQRVDQFFKEKMKKGDTLIVGVGSVMGVGLVKWMDGKNLLTIGELAAIVHSFCGKSDADLGGGEYACVEATNAILVLGFMRGLSIKQMVIIDVNNSDGALIYEPFWY